MEKIDTKKNMQEYRRRAVNAKARNKKLRHPEARYTLVLHHAKKQLSLTLTEYVLADVVHKLSGNHSRVPGWCIASKAYLGGTLDVSERSVFSLIKNLKEKGVVEADDDTGYLRTTEKWQVAVEVTKDRYFSK